MTVLANLSPLAHPDAWDKILIKGVESPGLASVGEVKRKHAWDEKGGKGSQGATLTYTGRGAAHITVTFQLWDDGMRGDTYFAENDHFAQWEEFIPLLEYDPTKKQPTAVDFFHPSIIGLGIRSVVVEEISSIAHKGGGMYEASISLIEYNPPPKASAVATPTSSAAGTNGADGSKAPPGDPPDPALLKAQQELQKSLDDAKALGPLP